MYGFAVYGPLCRRTGAPPVQYAAAKAGAARVRDLAQHTDWTSHDGLFTLFRVLMAAPWPVRVIDTAAAPMPLSRDLARIFDSTCVPHHCLRPTVNRWVRASARNSTYILSTWADQVQAAWTASGGNDDLGVCFTHPPTASIPPRLRALCGLADN